MVLWGISWRRFRVTVHWFPHGLHLSWRWILSRRWFGTDGIRGVANVDLTPELALRVGRAAARVLRSEGPPRVRVGMGTRLSGPVLSSAVAAGIAAEGGAVYLGGILPVSYTHLRAHETKANLVCRLLLDKKRKLRNIKHYIEALYRTDQHTRNIQ